MEGGRQWANQTQGFVKWKLGDAFDEADTFNAHFCLAEFSNRRVMKLKADTVPLSVCDCL